MEEFPFEQSRKVGTFLECWQRKLRLSECTCNITVLSNVYCRQLFVTMEETFHMVSSGTDF